MGKKNNFHNDDYDIVDVEDMDFTSDIEIGEKQGISGTQRKLRQEELSAPDRNAQKEPEAYWGESAEKPCSVIEKPSGTGKKRQILVWVCVCAGAFCLLAGAGILIRKSIDTRVSQNQMEALRSQSESAEQSRENSKTVENSSLPSGSDNDSLENSHTKEPENTGIDQEPQRIPNPYLEAFRTNSDMAGWLKIEGTKIDYPVMQTMEDENYYLKRGFDRKNNQNGCLILDTDSIITEPLSTNQIIHGHNMKSGEMFGTLTSYEDPAYCEEHKYIQLYTKECLRNYEVISVFRSQVYKKTDEVFKFYKFFQADTEEEFNDWYNNIMKLSEFDTGVTAGFGDRFLTLSTCVYHVENGRLVVVAKEIGTGEYYEAVD